MRPEHDLVLGDRYVLTRPIAVGGMGEVWEGTDRVLSRPVAVKILKDELRTAPAFIERFRAEARHAGGLAILESRRSTTTARPTKSPTW